MLVVDKEDGDQHWNKAGVGKGGTCLRLVVEYDRGKGQTTPCERGMVWAAKEEKGCTVGEKGHTWRKKQDPPLLHKTKAGTLGKRHSIRNSSYCGEAFTWYQD